MKILNLYAGIGGNRKLWGDAHEITAVEIDPKIAKIYQDFFPNDKVVVGDAHEYLLEHFEEFEFIWGSPPCPTHSKLRFLQEEFVYPDMSMYQEILLLEHWFKGNWVIENVVPYYESLITPTIELHRHLFWSNFHISHKSFRRVGVSKTLRNEREVLQKEFGFNLDSYTGVDRRLLLRNCVVPELGKYILDSSLNTTA